MERKNFRLKRDDLEPNRYEYLDVDESNLYDKAKAMNLTQKQACRAVCSLLREMAWREEAEHDGYQY
jgi:hypothetical protein